MSPGDEAVPIRRDINAEGEMILPRDRGLARAVPALETQHPDHGGEIWWETDYGRWRLRMEVAAMKRFGRFRLVRQQDQLHWAGVLVSRLRHRGGLRQQRFVVRVSYPAHFPHVAPTVFIESPTLPSDTPHLIGPQQPCLYDPRQGTHHGYDRARSTAATLISWTTLWIHALETWRVDDVWPGRGL